MEQYLRSCRTALWQAVFRAETEYLVPLLEGSRNVLSVGCGPAVIEGALTGRGFRVTGLDISREALDQAPDTVRTVAGRAEDMPFPESSFDAAIYVASLQFIEDYKMALENTARVLRPGGKLIVMLLNPASEFFKEKSRDPNSYVNKIRHANLNEIEGAIAENFSVRAEYFMGLEDGKIAECRDPGKSVLYVIAGAKRLARLKKKT